MYQVTVGAAMTPDPISVGPEADLKTIVEVLLSHDISSVPVVTRSGALIGVVSEADLMRGHESTSDGEGLPRAYARKRARERWNMAWASRAFDLMVTPVLTLDAGDPLSAAAREFGRSGVRRLYITGGGKLVGVLSRGDLLKAFVRPDDVIKADVLREACGGTAAVDVAVDRGVVTLSGELESRGDTDLVSRLAAHVIGVVYVVNELRYRRNEKPDLAHR
ncbi:CBS domain-containing protein [Saccharomonospora sp. NPDC006951]